MKTLISAFERLFLSKMPTLDDLEKQRDLWNRFKIPVKSLNCPLPNVLFRVHCLSYKYRLSLQC